jgi:protein phosphatase 1G
VAVIHGNKLYVANAGDSRCILSRGKETIPMTEDHKPTNPEEERRIKAAGGFVAEGRINGGLNLSRAIGDMNYKTSEGKKPEEQVVTANPDVNVTELTPADQFIILACDGIWDMMTNDQAVAFVQTRLSQGMDPSKICAQMCDCCLATDTQGIGKGCDNMSAMVVVFKNPKA